LKYQKNLQGQENPFPCVFLVAAAVRLLLRGGVRLWEFFPVLLLTRLQAELDDPILKPAESSVALEHCRCCYWLNSTFFLNYGVRFCRANKAVISLGVCGG